MRVCFVSKIEIGMDLVAYDDDIIALCKIHDALEFFASPDAADGIVRAAEDHHSDAFSKLLFEQVKVHLPAGTIMEKRAPDHLAAEDLNGAVEGTVNRRLDENGVLFFGKRAHAEEDAVHNARAVEDPFRLHIKAIAALEPACLGCLFRCFV